MYNVVQYRDLDFGNINYKKGGLLWIMTYQLITGVKI